MFYVSVGLTVPTLTALSKMIDQEEVGEALNSLIKEVNHQYSQGNPIIQVKQPLIPPKNQHIGKTTISIHREIPSYR